MAWGADRYTPVVPGARLPVESYDQSGEDHVMVEGERLFVPCEGGPCRSRVETFPPRLEVAETGGTYVLIDVGPRRDWHYLFVPAG